MLRNVAEGFEPGRFFWKDLFIHMAKDRDHDNEPSDYVKGGNFLV
jgi:hypothetical protein